MKTLRVLPFILTALFAVMPVAAQTTASSTTPSSKDGAWSSYYYINVPIEKVYPHRLGYVVSYRKSGAGLGQVYIPLKWFKLSEGKGSLDKLRGAEGAPYLTIFYKEGAFSHIVLHVRYSLSDPTWGALPSGTAIDDRFAVEELKLEF